MNQPAPTPTPRTDAATYPADCLGKTLVTNRDLARALETELTALTADRDELRAALALGQENCDAVYDELRGDCDELRGDVVRLTAERDQLRAEAKRFQRLQRFTDTAAAEMKAGLITFGGIAELRAEREQLRAEVERLTPYVSKAILTKTGTMLCSPQVGVAFNEMRARAEKSEADLAKERARLDWLGDNVEEIYRERDQRGSCVYLSGENIRDAIDAAMKEGAK